MGLFCAHGIGKLIEKLLIFQVFGHTEVAVRPQVIFIEVEHEFGHIFNANESIATDGIERHSFADHVIELV